VAFSYQIIPCADIPFKSNEQTDTINQSDMKIVKFLILLEEATNSWMFAEALLELLKIQRTVLVSVNLFHNLSHQILYT
jgi:hypothetical protein